MPTSTCQARSIRPFFVPDASFEQLHNKPTSPPFDESGSCRSKRSGRNKCENQSGPSLGVYFLFFFSPAEIKRENQSVYQRTACSRVFARRTKERARKQAVKITSVPPSLVQMFVSDRNPPLYFQAGSQIHSLPLSSRFLSAGTHSNTFLQLH